MINLSLLRLCVGFQFQDSVLEEQLFTPEVEIIDGTYHLENRFDPQTGKQQLPVKVWESNPKTNRKYWLDINGKRYNTETPTFVKVMSERLGCCVERFGDKETNKYGYSFYVNETLPYRKVTDQFALSSPTIFLEQVIALQKPLNDLAIELRRINLKPDEPRVFISQYYV